jgi:hypothetical protein
MDKSCTPQGMRGPKLLKTLAGKASDSAGLGYLYLSNSSSANPMSLAI